jgi:DNA replication licensing factor MCM5
LIPTGEMPRSRVLTVDRYLTDKCTPGNRIKVIGVLSILNQNNSTLSVKSKNHIQKSYIKVIGLVSNNNIDSSSGSFMGFAMPNITDED